MGIRNVTGERKKINKNRKSLKSKNHDDNKEPKILDESKIQYKTEEKIRNYKCNDCEKKFETPSKLKRHIDAVHEKIQNFKCDACEKSVSQKHHLKSHICHKYIPKQNKTGQKFISSENNSPSKIISSTEPEFIEDGDTSDEYDVKTVDIEQENEIMNDISHVEREETNTKDLICDVCKLAFESQTRFKIHMTKRHSEKKSNILNKNHVCEKCGKTYDRQIRLEKHESTCNLQKIAKVSIIKNNEYDTSGKSSLKGNIDSVDNLNHECATCGKSFKNSRNLKRHITAIHDVTQTHECNACGKSFANSSTLKRHDYNHHDYKMSDGKQESDSVSKSKKRWCQWCHIYTSNSNFSRHLITHHKGKQEEKVEVNSRNVTVGD